ncbi:MAG: anti-sigma factor [Gemmatimonadaceae bacterium]|nr:anti-sigma factor [Gemmatimonadaceae bacterium]
MSNDIETLLELVPAYLMDTLTDEERSQFEEAQRDPAMCKAIDAEIAVQREAFDRFAQAHATPAPDALRARALERMRNQPQAPVAEAAPVAFSTPTLVADQTRVGDLPQRTGTPSRTTPRAAPTVRSWWLSGTLGTALAASAVFSVMSQREIARLRSQLSEVQATVRATQTRLASRDATVQVLTRAGRDLVLVQLVANTTAGPAIQVYWNVKDGRAVIHAAGMKAISATRAYALWMIRDGKPVPLALFTPDADGSQLLNDVRVPQSTAGVAAFAVTEEPAEGSPQPTMTPFLVGTVGAK